jgi:hypothetical protein
MTDDVTAWALRNGLPAQVLVLLHRAGILKHVDFTGKELVRLCATPEGRARFLSPAEVRQALRENAQGDDPNNVWTTRDMAAFMRTGAVPGWLEDEYAAFLCLDEHAEELARWTRIDLHTMSAPIGRPRPESLPRAQPRARAPRRRATVATRAGPPRKSGDDEDPHDRELNAWARSAATRMAVRIARRQGHRLTHHRQAAVA